jgi:hypothetical protein
MENSWKIIKECKFSNMNECVESLLKKNYQVSHWIKDIAKRTKTDLENIKFPIILTRIRVSELGIKSATTLKTIYNLLEKENFKLINPLISINLRFYYDEQPKGEWLRIAVPFNSMIDSDGVPHLPKLGHGLGMHFLETYWSYPDSIFHPHNEFIVQKNSDI